MTAGKAPSAKPTLVVADDYPPMLEKVLALLRDDFNVVASVGNGADAVDAAMKFDPDVVILDIAMPGMDGIEAAGLIRGSRTKIIFLTAGEDRGEEACRATGGLACVLKARMRSDLIFAIHEILAGRTFFSNDSMRESRRNPSPSG